MPREDEYERFAGLDGLNDARAVVLAGRDVPRRDPAADACPLEHPMVGRLRCGEWLLFAGVHDLMHLEQLHDISTRLGR